MAHSVNSKLSRSGALWKCHKRISPFCQYMTSCNKQQAACCSQRAAWETPWGGVGKLEGPQKPSASWLGRWPTSDKPEKSRGEAWSHGQMKYLWKWPRNEREELVRGWGMCGRPNRDIHCNVPHRCCHNKRAAKNTIELWATILFMSQKCQTELWTLGRALLERGNWPIAVNI